MRFSRASIQWFGSCWDQCPETAQLWVWRCISFPVTGGAEVAPTDGRHSPARQSSTVETLASVGHGRTLTAMPILAALASNLRTLDTKRFRGEKGGRERGRQGRQGPLCSGFCDALHRVLLKAHGLPNNTTSCSVGGVIGLPYAVRLGSAWRGSTKGRLTEHTTCHCKTWATKARLHT